MEPIPVAIIGTGGIANTHAAAFQAFPERVRTVAAVDIDPDRARAFADKYGIPEAYGSSGEMLTKVQPTLVSIATPPMTHAPIMIECLEAGAHAWCEKPFCASLAELDQIQDAEKRTGKFAACIVQWRYAAAAERFRQLQKDGLLGRPLVGLCQTAWFRPQKYYDVPWRGKWETELGGPTMGHGIHAMDFYLSVSAPWREIRAHAANLDRDIHVEDTSTAIVQFEDRHVSTMVNTCLSPRQTSYLRWDFQNATVELTHLYEHRREHWSLSLPPETDNPALLDAFSADYQDLPGSHATQLQRVLDSLDQDKPLPADTHSIRQTTDFLSSLYKSAFTGQTITRDSIQPGDPFYEHVAGSFRSPEGSEILRR